MIRFNPCPVPAIRVLFLFALAICCGVLRVAAAPVYEPLYGFASGPIGPQSKLVQASDGSFYGTSYTGGTSNLGTVFRVASDGSVSVLVSFNRTNGANPVGGLVIAGDGNLYGTTQFGGTNNYGTVFRVTTSGVLTTMVNFSTYNLAYPVAALIVGPDGHLYGTTSAAVSGANTQPGGNCFQLTLAGVYSNRAVFTSATGTVPRGRLVADSSNNLYGTATQGGTGNYGTIFRISTTNVVSVLYHFTETNTVPVNGSFPESGLVLIGSTLYGTAYGGGNSDLGTIFRITTSGGSFTTMLHFNGTNGSRPVGDLEVGSDGLLYGTTSKGGASDRGTVFRITTGSSFTKLVDFNGTNGREPQGGLLRGADNLLYGTVSQSNVGDGGVFRLSGTTLTNFATFVAVGGSQPRGGLVQDAEGNFYGTTFSGGNSSMGTVFRVNLQGVCTTLASFSGANGRNPWAGLVRGPDGNFYGTTHYGGTSDLGTVFRITPAGVLTTLASFTGTNGCFPWARMIVGADGHLYGTTFQGGATDQGTIFRITTAGVLTTIVSLSNATGCNPRGSLVLASDGNYYLATFQGGTNFLGTIVRMTPAGTVTVLTQLSATTGGKPVGGLIQASDGNLYGTTSQSGSSSGGTAFRVTTAGVLTVLVNFPQNAGNKPFVGLVEGVDGNFYGATSAGLTAGFGDLFRMTPAGVVTSLAAFPAAGLSSELMRGADGSFYSTTQVGGLFANGQPAGGGMVYRLRLGPLAVTLGSQSVTSNSATLTGTVNPDGLATSVSFQYGTDPTFATFSTASAGSLAAGTSVVPVQAQLSGLLPSTQYFFRTAALNAENPLPQVGGTLTFTTQTPPAVPDIDIEAPSGTPLSSGGVLAFGSSVTSQAVQRLVLIRSSGTAPLGGLAVSLEGAAAGDFSVSQLSTTSLVPSFSTSVTVSFTPTVPGIRSATLRIVSNDADENPFLVQLSGEGISPYQNWASSAGLAGLNAEPSAVPFQDGVSNLLKFAFNMNGAGPDVRVLGAANSAGLPWARVDRSGPAPLLKLDFMRRKNSGLLYVGEQSSSLGSFVAMAGNEVVTPVDDTWERVTLEVPMTDPRLFLRVRVVQP